MQKTVLTRWVLCLQPCNRYTRLLKLLLIISTLFTAVTTTAQQVSLDIARAPVEAVFKEIQKQSGYSFIYTRDQVQHATPITIRFKSLSLADALDVCFKSQPFSWQIQEKYIILRSKDKTIATAGIVVTGTVLDEQDIPVPGALVAVYGTTRSVITNELGQFTIDEVKPQAMLHISSIGHKPTTLQVHNAAPLVIYLEIAVKALDETLVVAYGTTTKRMSTGSVGKVSSREITNQPVSNVLSTISGRVAGVTVTPSSGVPGSMIKIQVRGRNSIAQGSEPLFIIDGVPLAAQNQPVNNISSVLSSGAGTGLSPLASLSPADIESIEILKDADATAIYGSRGANGVVLISTRKGKEGKTRFSINVNRSISALSRTVEMMNTQEYLKMRKEAFGNDGLTPTNTTAPDLLVWDTSRYTNLQKLLYSHHAPTVNVETALTGGDRFTRFLVAATYRREKTMFDESMGLTRGTGSFNLNHRTKDNKFELNTTVNLGYTTNNLTARGVGGALSLAPVLPPLYDSSGRLKWQEGGIAYDNPLAFRLNRYDARTQSLTGRLTLGYTPVRGLKLTTAVGVNTLNNYENTRNPLAAQNPLNNPLAALEIANNHFRGWIIEPHAEYNTRLAGGNLSLLAGATLQDNLNRGDYTRATGFASDNLIASLAAAPTIANRRNTLVQYRYHAVFARLKYEWQKKYLLNISGRADGSSRFGPGKQFSAFGAAGAGWIFTNEAFIKRAIKWMSYGKLRMSYGTSGNDQITDYGYMDAWGSTNTYQGSAALYPLNLFNPDYRWEENRKMEVALETGILQDRLLFTLAWYRNRSGNQLVNYRLPSQTGFNSVLKNMDAVVENAGFELEITSRNIAATRLEWTTAFNLTLPRNRLVSFPGLTASSYANFYVEGESLNLIYRYRYTGVDPATGVFTYDDINKDGVINTRDYVVSGNTDPVFFGGLHNTIRYKAFEVDITAEFRKQKGLNYLYSLYSSNNVPGMMYNLPRLAKDRWQKPGDVATLQQLTASTASNAYRASSNLLNSDGVYGNADFLRLRNISVRYQLPVQLIKKVSLKEASLYLQGHNLFVITNYKGGDPEVQNLFTQNPLRTFAAGVNLGW